MSSVPHTVTFVSALAVALLAGCGDDRPIREWRAEDHGQPNQAAPDPALAPQQAGPNTEARAAAALWTVSCAECHGAEGRGDGPERPPDAEMPDYTDPAWQATQTDEELAEVIRNGRDPMPLFGDRVNAQGIAALVRHIRRLGGQEPGQDPAQVQDQMQDQAPAPDEAPDE